MSCRQRAPADLDAEQEVDFGRYWRLIAAALVAAGRRPRRRPRRRLPRLAGDALVDLQGDRAGLPRPAARARTAPRRSRARRRRSGSSRTSSRATATVREVADRSGLKPGRLRGHITTKPMLGITGAKVGTPAPLLAITVTGSPPRRSPTPRTRSRSRRRPVSGYPDVKIEKLKEQIDFDDRASRSATTASRSRSASSSRRFSATRRSPTEKLLLLANINTTLVTVEQRLGQLETDRLTAQQFLSLAQNVESGRITLAGRRRRRPPARTAAPAPRSAG